MANSIRVWPLFFFYKQKTAYDMRISDWSSDVCSTNLRPPIARAAQQRSFEPADRARAVDLGVAYDACRIAAARMAREHRIFGRKHLGGEFRGHAVGHARGIDARPGQSGRAAGGEKRL